MQVYVTSGHSGPVDELRAKVTRLDDIGIGGYMAGDHLFITTGSDRRDAYRPHDPFTLLSAVGALSDRLVLGTIVANASFSHPALILRHFAQLAAMYDGERVLAGLGSGWNVEEFEAIGMAMPDHRARSARLADAAVLARRLFDDGIADVDGDTMSAHGLPLAPRPAVPPRLMLGGGSRSLLEIAGRYGDHIDLNGSGRKPLGASADIHADSARRALATLDDLSERVAVLEAAERAAGRSPGTVTRSIVIDHIEICPETERADREAAYCDGREVERRSLDDNPYVLIGEPARLRDLLAERSERLGLAFVIVPDGAHLEQFVDEVVAPV